MTEEDVAIMKTLDDETLLRSYRMSRGSQKIQQRRAVTDPSDHWTRHTLIETININVIQELSELNLRGIAPIEP
jgi:hypothetical protein